MASIPTYTSATHKSKSSLSITGKDQTIHDDQGNEDEDEQQDNDNEDDSPSGDQNKRKYSQLNKKRGSSTTVAPAIKGRSSRTSIKSKTIMNKDT